MGVFFVDADNFAGRVDKRDLAWREVRGVFEIKFSCQSVFAEFGEFAHA